MVLAINLVSVKLFGEMEFWFAAIKVAAIVIFMVIAIVVLVDRHPVDGHATGPQLIFANGGFFPHGALAALLILQGIVFAYAGIEMVGVTAGEAAEPRKVIPKAVNAVGWRIAIFYVGSILLLVMLLPWGDYHSGQSPFVTFLTKLGVPGAGGIMDIVILTAALSSVNSGLYSTGRILRSLSVNGAAPKFTGRIGKNGVPYTGVLLTAGIYLLGILLDVFVKGEAFEIALNFSALGIIGMWIMIMVANLGLQRRAKQGIVPRPQYRLPGRALHQLPDHPVPGRGVRAELVRRSGRPDHDHRLARDRDPDGHRLVRGAQAGRRSEAATAAGAARQDRLTSTCAATARGPEVTACRGIAYC